ncbi:hypothetical protein KIOSHI_265 [Bacillus phage Kioshi]|nr:hypothetical protein KIOSHI_9 [Bacillus phage Kioshi]AXQ67881.1 hypothetical protein KIOSHI_265 [Bacillus phage Kioshi]
MREEITFIYQYDELKAESKENAVKWFQETLNEEFTIESEQITENMKTTLENKGYEGLDVFWSLNHCQGDGVAFYGRLTTVELVSIAERLLSDKDYKRLKLVGTLADFEIEIYDTNNRYNHYNSMKVYLDDVQSLEDFPKIWELLQKLERAVSDDIREISKELEKQGYAEIDYYYSKEYAESEIRANEYEFDVDGGRI